MSTAPPPGPGDGPGTQPTGPGGPWGPGGPSGPGGPWGNPWGPPPGPPVPPVPAAPTAGKATTALILGVVSLFLCGLFTGIPAIFVGFSARREIRESSGRLSGDGLAIGGIITGVIGTLFSIALAVVLIVAVAFGTAVKESFDESCQSIVESPSINDPAFSPPPFDCP